MSHGKFPLRKIRAQTISLKKLNERIQVMRYKSEKLQTNKKNIHAEKQAFALTEYFTDQEELEKKLSGS